MILELYDSKQFQLYVHSCLICTEYKNKHLPRSYVIRRALPNLEFYSSRICPIWRVFYENIKFKLHIIHFPSNGLHINWHLE
jgi:hypothetical protein